MSTLAFAFGTFANDASIGSFDWSNPGNAAADDAAWATVSLDDGNVSRYLKCTNRTGAALLSTDTLDSLSITVKRQFNGPATGIKDQSVRLVVGGVIVGADKSTSAAWPIAVDGTATFTWSSAELITAGLDYAAFNASNFGVVIAAKNEGTSNFIASINYIAGSVEYGISDVTPTVAVDSFVFSLQAMAVSGDASAAVAVDSFVFNSLSVAVEGVADSTPHVAVCDFTFNSIPVTVVAEGAIVPEQPPTLPNTGMSGIGVWERYRVDVRARGRTQNIFWHSPPVTVKRRLFRSLPVQVVADGKVDVMPSWLGWNAGQVKVQGKAEVKLRKHPAKHYLTRWQFEILAEDEALLNGKELWEAELENAFKDC